LSILERKLRIYLLCLIGIILASCAPVQAPSSTSAQQAFENYVVALNDGDVAKAATYYDTADGFHWIERGHVQYETGADAANALKTLQTRGGKIEDDIGYDPCCRAD